MIEVVSTYKTEGIIIKRTNYGEADRILTIYTKHYGKIKAIAKGVRKITSRRGGNLELFNCCRFFLVKGRHWDIITEAVVMRSFLSRMHDLKSIGDAFYVAELVDRLTPWGQTQGEILSLLISALEGKIKPDDFTVELLRLLGYWPGDGSRIDLPDYVESIIEQRLNSIRLWEKL